MGLVPTLPELEAYFHRRGAEMPGLGTIRVDGRPVSYAVSGPVTGPLVLFIHGSPGGWTAWKSFLAHEDLRHLRLVSVDRPGYGGSGRGEVMPSVQHQASHMAAVLRHVASGRPAVVVGHSLGGPIAGRLALDAPELVRGLVLVAPSVDPALEEVKWFQIPAQWTLVRRIIPPELDVCNREILPLKPQLAAMEDRWNEIGVPTVVIQGLEDTLVPPGNADFLEARLPKPFVIRRVPGLNHFVPWERPDMIRAAILELSKETPS